MAEQGGQSSIGAISVDVTANTAPLEAGLGRAKVATEQAAASLGTANTAAAGLRHQIKELTGGITGLIGTLLGLVARITFVGAAIGGLGAGLVHLATRMERMSAASRKLGLDINSSFKDIGARGLSEIQQELKQVEDASANAYAELNKLSREGGITKKSARFRRNEIERNEEDARERIFAKAKEDADVQAFEARRNRERAEYDKRVEQITRERELKRIDARADAENANRAAEAEAARFDRVDSLRGRAQSSASPLAQLGFQKDALAKEIADAFAQAKSPIEQQLIIAFGGAIAKGFKQQEEELKQTFKNAFLDMLNEAMQDSQGAFGIRDMIVQLSQISRQIQVIQQTMPR